MIPSPSLSGVEIGKVLPFDVREQQWITKITKLSVSGRASRGLDLVIHMLTPNMQKKQKNIKS